MPCCVAATDERLFFVYFYLTGMVGFFFHTQQENPAEGERRNTRVYCSRDVSVHERTCGGIYIPASFLLKT